jgi:hypothetical protein
MLTIMRNMNILTKARAQGGGGFPTEAYFYFLAHKYLPESIDRVLAIDAGDIIIDGDIGEFYFAPFEGNYIITSMAFSRQNELYTKEDLKNPQKEISIITEYINSGAIMLNLEKMRQNEISFDYYNNIVDYIILNHKPFTSPFFPKPIYYTYDQGLFAASFVGEIKFWGYELFGYNALYMPYNFRPFVFETEKKRLGINERGAFDPGYKPYIIHLLGNKPWATDNAKFDTLLPISRKYINLFRQFEKAAKRDLEALGITASDSGKASMPG